MSNIQTIKSYEDLVKRLDEWKEEKYNPITKQGRLNVIKDRRTLGNCPFYSKYKNICFCLLFPNDYRTNDCKGVCYHGLPCDNYRYLFEDVVYRHILENKKQIEERLKIVIQMNV